MQSNSGPNPICAEHPWNEMAIGNFWHARVHGMAIATSSELTLLSSGILGTGGPGKIIKGWEAIGVGYNSAEWAEQVSIGGKKESDQEKASPWWQHPLNPIPGLN